MAMPHPADPHDVGVPEEVPDSAHIEGARTLADEAAPALERLGFSAEQVRLWADAFLAEHGPGSVNDFLAWVRNREDRAGD